MRTSGVWYVSASGNTEEKHFPSGVSNGWLQIYAFNGEVKQLFYRFGTENVNDSQIFVRTFYTPSQSWSNWVRLITNTDLNPEVYIVPKPSNNSVFTFSNTFQVSVRKSGKVVTIQLNISASMAAAGDFVTAFTIPQKYKPLTDVVINYIVQNTNKSMVLFITRDGEVKFSNLNSAIDDWLCRQCVTYVTN